MAYASVASLLQTIDLVNYHRDSSLSPRFKDQITSLEKNTSFLQSFLEDDPERAKNWEETIREVTDRAEEMIDLLVSDSLLKSELHYGLDELEKVKEEIESTADRVKGRSTKPKAGPDEELMGIIGGLLEGSPEREIIAVVGMGGVGKSALARNAYNHPSVVKHFDVRASAKVSQNCSRRQIVSDLLRSMNIESASNSDFELIYSLSKSLRRKRYLIVLYDVWNIGDWDMVRNGFPDNGNGSRIVLTTRIRRLADVVAGHTHLIKMLDEDKTWDMLREKIFKGDPCPSQLEHVGKMIAGKCRGHLLSVELVSGILVSDQTEAAWEDVSENIDVIYDYDVTFPQILRLSYTYLPHHLRPCFLYLGIFPEGEIHVSKLVKLWVAEGFLNESGSKSFEVVGEECVEELVRRSLVSVSKRKSDGSIKSIAVHEAVKDLCLMQGLKDNFILDVSRFERYDQDQQAVAMEHQWCRRVSCSNNSHDFLEGFYESTIRTIMLYMSYGKVGVRRSMGNVRLLRILDLSNVHDYNLPEEVFELFHLRYLAFYCGFRISEAISNLQNLQTLIIICPRENGGMLYNLPEGIWRMPQLRHLFNFYFKLPSLKGGENSALENLETLSRVVNFVCSKQNLKMIPNMKKLALLYTKKFRDVELHNLIYLNKLEILKIEMELSFGEEHKMSSSFPPSLKKLNLCGLQLPWEDMKIVGSLPNLEVLKLRKHACVGETWETNEGGFSRLKYLLIEESNLENWRSETSHFPKLKTLVLHSCLHLSKVPYEMAEIPTLQLIELDAKNQSVLDSAKQIQEDRKSLGDDGLQILVV